MSSSNFINNIWLNQVYLPKGYSLKQSKNRKKKNYRFALDLHYTFASAQDAKSDVQVVDSFFMEASLQKKLTARCLNPFPFHQKYRVNRSIFMFRSVSKFMLLMPNLDCYLYDLQKNKDKILRINSCFGDVGLIQKSFDEVYDGYKDYFYIENENEDYHEDNYASYKNYENYDDYENYYNYNDFDSYEDYLFGKSVDDSEYDF